MIDRIFFKKGILFLIFTTVSCLISTQLEAFASKRLIELDEKNGKIT